MNTDGVCNICGDDSYTPTFENISLKFEFFLFVSSVLKMLFIT